MSTLICITTCKRLDLVKRYILPYLEYVNGAENTHFAQKCVNMLKKIRKYVKKTRIFSESKINGKMTKLDIFS